MQKLSIFKTAVCMNNDKILKTNNSLRLFSVCFLVWAIGFTFASKAAAGEKGLTWSNCYVASIGGVYYDSCWREKSCREGECICDTAKSLCRIQGADSLLAKDSSWAEGFLVGPDSPNDDLNESVGVTGTDLGNMYLHEGKIYFVFGDTWDGEYQTTYRGQNPVAYTTDFDASDGITLDDWILDDDDEAKSIAPIDNQATNPFDCNNLITGRVFTRGANSSMSIDGIQFVWLQDILVYGAADPWPHTAPCGENADRYWKTSRNAIIGSDDWQNPSVTMDLTSLWSVEDNLYDEDDPQNKFLQVATVRYGDYVYLWGNREGRMGETVRLARVLADKDLVQDESNYQYYDGTDFSDEIIDAVNVMPTTGDKIGDSTVMWNPFANRWMMLSFEVTTARIVARFAEEPWGDWEGKTAVYSGDEYIKYAPFVHEIYTENGGETIYFIWSHLDVRTISGKNYNLWRVGISGLRFRRV